MSSAKMFTDTSYVYILLDQHFTIRPISESEKGNPLCAQKWLTCVRWTRRGWFSTKMIRTIRAERSLPQRRKPGVCRRSYLRALGEDNVTKPQPLIMDRVV